MAYVSLYSILTILTFLFILYFTIEQLVVLILYYKCHLQLHLNDASQSNTFVTWMPSAYFLFYFTFLHTHFMPVFDTFQQDKQWDLVFGQSLSALKKF